MQFIPFDPKFDKTDDMRTFWESQEYRPHKKVVIFTTERYLMPNKCYSFDFNYLFQAQKFQNEPSKKSPLVL